MADCSGLQRAREAWDMATCVARETHRLWALVDDHDVFRPLPWGKTSAARDAVRDVMHLAGLVEDCIKQVVMAIEAQKREEMPND